MKYTKHILFAGLAAVTFASCNQEAAAPSEADIATKVSEKVEAAKAQLKADCDKNVMDEAIRLADSVMVKAANKPARTVTKVVNAPAPKTPVKAPVKVPVKVTEKSKTTQGGGLRTQSDKAKANDKTSTQGGGLRTQSDKSKSEDSKAVQGGGLRSRSDQNVEKK
ncbi:MAG: hypothetical protein KA275_09215 [Chitinophagaceae bacterium]|nr:hypothetical protein [Chitinophagaceae bacterium]